MKKPQITTLLIVFVLSLFIVRIDDVYGYGYGIRGKDTLVAVYENITAHIQDSDYEGIKFEVKKIEVPLSNYHNYYGINLKPAFSQSIKEKNATIILKTIEQLIYFAVREKIYWNTNEKLEKIVASKARLKVIFQYYKVLKSKIIKYDKENNTSHNKEIMGIIISMKNTLGTSGTFGYKAIPPKLKEFIRLSGRLEEVLALIFPHFEDGFKANIKQH